MLKQLQKRKAASRQRGFTSAASQRGFTIIEVLIVLAIAGLIMVVVFLAVPALQRSGRNSGLNTSANNILSAVGTFSSNNGGTLPDTSSCSASLCSGTLTLSKTGANSEVVKLDTGVQNVTINPAAGAVYGTATPTTSDIGKVQIITGTTAVCNSTANGISGTGSTRSYVVLYVVEGGNNSVLVKCVGS